MEVFLTSLGVFFALTGEQWRENAHNRDLGETSLRRFRTELQANRKAVATVEDYHASRYKNLQTYLTTDAKTRSTVPLQIVGLRPAAFEHTAWDLALTTQSLANIEPDLAFSLSRIYGEQQAYMELTRGMIQAMYLRPPSEDREAFLRSVSVYWGDVVFLEPALLQKYDEILPQIGRALGESAPEKAAAE